MARNQQQNNPGAASDVQEKQARSYKLESR
jgi:hypothetical protein